MSQWGILLFSVAGMWLMNDHRPKVRRWGPIFGLCGQPFWMYSTYANHLWGMFAITFLFTAMNLRGIYNFWFRSN